MAAITSSLRPASLNRRRRVRHKVQTPAYASFTGESNAAVLDLYEVIDLSEDGVAIQCSTPFEASRVFDLCLDLAESTGSVYTTAELIWSNQSGRSGFRFSKLQPTSLSRLREWLFLNAVAGVANAEAGAYAAQPDSVEKSGLRPSYTDTLAALTAVQREAESLGTDLGAALDLIATRARTLLRASGAAIALAGEDPKVMICRASSGSDAPPVGAPLHVGSGFSGECVLTGKLLLCADTESDRRVDRDSCRMLGIRSILAAPVRLGGKVIGILEMFSSIPNCFTEQDTIIGQHLAETVLAAINRVERKQNSPPSLAAAGTLNSSPATVPFSANAQENGKEQERKTVIEKIEHGISLPRTHLIVLICAAVTIPFALGYILKPAIQSKFHRHGRAQLQTVLASSGSGNSPLAVSSAAIDMASLDELKRLAEQGDIPAQNAMGRRFAQGEGVAQDEVEAVRWFTKAAEQGSVVAQSRLGALYWRGKGLPQDVNKAYFWSVLARAGGDESSKALAMVLASHMTRAQSTSIEQQAENWFRQHQGAAKPSAGR